MVFHVINLDRSPERWRFMEAMCAERGIVAHRVAAIDGEGLSEADLERVSPLIDGVRKLATSEIGCFESHKEAWRLIAAGEHSHACVLEDDVFLAKGVGSICAEVLRAFPQLDVVKLNNYVEPVYLSDIPIGTIGAVKLFRPMQRTIDAGAYLISRDCARKALANFATYREAVDNVLFDPSSDRAIAQLVPAVGVQAKYASFQFMDAGASRSTIQRTRAARWAAMRRHREPQPPAVRFCNELRRFWRRRLFPNVLFITNRFCRPEDRMSRRRIKFADL